MADIQRKYYAVIIGKVLLKLSTESKLGSMAIVDRIKASAADGYPLYCDTLNPADFKAFDDTVTMVIPAPGMVFEIQPWNKFVANQKEAQKQMQKQQQQQQFAATQGRGVPMIMANPRGGRG